MSLVSMGANVMIPETSMLPDDVAALKVIIAQRDETIAAKDHTIAILKTQLQQVMEQIGCERTSDLPNHRVGESD